MLVSDGRSGSNIDDLMRINLSKVEWAGFHLISYVTVVTLLDPLPNPILFVDKSNTGDSIRFSSWGERS